MGLYDYLCLAPLLKSNIIISYNRAILDLCEGNLLRRILVPLMMRQRDATVCHDRNQNRENSSEIEGPAFGMTLK